MYTHIQCTLEYKVKTDLRHASVIYGQNYVCGHVSLNPHAKTFNPRARTPASNVILDPNTKPFSPGQTKTFCPYICKCLAVSNQKFNLNPRAKIFIIEHSSSKISRIEEKNNFTHPRISVLNPEATIFTPYLCQIDDNYNESLLFNDTPSVNELLTPTLSEIGSFSEKSIAEELTLSLSPAPSTCMCTPTPNSKFSTPIPDIDVGLSPNMVKMHSNKLAVEVPSLISPMILPDMDESKHSGSLNASDLLKNIRVSNVNRLIFGQLNINSIRNKFDALKYIVSGNLDILVITESKLDDSFPVGQFSMQGYAPPFRLDRKTNGGGGVLIYVRNDIACRELKTTLPVENIEGIFIELNLKRSKWLVFGGYNPSKDNISNFVTRIVPIIDYHMPKYDNFLLLGDFNSEMQEHAMKEFSEIYNLSNLIKDPTCFKNP